MLLTDYKFIYSVVCIKNSHSNSIAYYLPVINVREQLEFEKDGVTIILEWDEVNPLYSVDVSVIPELQVNISGSTAQLKVTYNTMYNVSVIVSPPCGQSSVVVFNKVYYYPRTSPRECN